MSSPFYAIRRGAFTGIVRSWEACEAAIVGYAGADVRGFDNLADALMYLVANAPEQALYPVPRELVVDLIGLFINQMNRHGLIPPRRTGSWWRDQAAHLRWLVSRLRRRP